MGGFNEDFGIFADLILFYRLEMKYNVLMTKDVLGIWRWGNNTSSKKKPFIS